MNYITSQIDRKINLLLALDKKSELKTHYQAKLELYLIITLGYLWNKNFEKLTIDVKEEVVSSILRPSIGSIINLSRKLDIEGELFGNKRLKTFVSSVNSYPNIRNEQIGHGFSFEDDEDSYINVFQNLLEGITENNSHFLFEPYDLIYVTKYSNNVFTGISFKPNGSDYSAWSCPDEVSDFKINSIYIKNSSENYHRLSPFIHMQDESDFYMFCNIEEKLTGRVKYNKLIRTGKITVDHSELANMNLSDDGMKKITANGTLINHFVANYKKYIDVGISNNIIKFLTKNNSSVFATLWGHGGIGKTAAIQNVCEILSNQESKKFDYIVFISAKDRYYNYYKGVIQEIKGSINSFNEIIVYLNSIIFNDSSSSAEKIILFEGKALIIIDDFETFSKVEKSKIISFIKQLNINNHKVILTTRSATLITGEEIETNELDEYKTVEFLINAFKNEFPEYNVTKDIKSFRKNSKLIHSITSGRPLFILQFAILLAQKGELKEAITIDIKSSEEAKTFLYDRIYDYLSTDAKNMFLGINLLVDSDDLSGLVDNLKFILNKEENLETFESALNELIKLRIIELIDKDFFKVYSPEILKLMRQYYENKGKEYDGDITSRYNLISNGKKLETDSALLKLADSKQLVVSENEVENLYRRIIKRENGKMGIRIKALLNYANYLFGQKGQVGKTIKLFNDYRHWFKSNPDFIIMNSRYCWAEGSISQRYEATEILKAYLASWQKIPEEKVLEILSALMVYSTNILVTERDNLKEQRRFNEINEQEYRWIYASQRERFSEIYNYPGMKLYKLTKDKNLMSVEPKTRNIILDGLVNFSEICIRMNKHDIANKICNKIINELPNDYHKPFQSKINKINVINGDTEVKNTDTQLGIKLKNALLDQFDKSK